jgi:hypothetical protein
MKPNCYVKINLRHKFSFLDMFMEQDAFKYASVAIFVLLKIRILIIKLPKRM